MRRHRLSCVQSLYVLLLCVIETCTGRALVNMVTQLYHVHEGDQVDIQLLRQGTAASSINVVVQVEDAYSQGGLDFIGTSQTIVFPAGTQDQVLAVTFTIADDDIPEPEEVFTLALRVTNGDAEAGSPSRARVSILANDDSHGIFGFHSLSPVRTEETEADSQLSLLVTRSRGAFGNVHLHYQVLTDTLSNADLGPVSDAVQFFTGETSKYIVLTIYADFIPEMDELFTIELTEAVGVDDVTMVTNPPVINTTRSQVNVTIMKNDAPIKFSQSEYRVEEASYDSSISLTITRGLTGTDPVVMGPTSESASVSYHLVPVSATPGADYVSYNSSVSFSPGITSTTLTIQILADTIPEDSESFRVVLSDAIGNVILAEPNICLVIISANDDHQGVLGLRTPSELAFPRIVVDEDEVAMVTGFVVERRGGSYGRVSVEWVLLRNSSSGGSGSGGDVLPTVGVATLEDGQSEQVIALQLIQDTEPEPVERYMLQLLSGSVVGGGRAEGVLQGELIIMDSDEAHGVVQFTGSDVQQLITTTLPRKLLLSLVRAGGTVGALHVQYDVTYLHDGVQKSDFLLSSVPGTAIFPAGQASLSVDVLIRDDAFLQIGAVFTVTLLSVTLSDGSDIQPYNTPRLGEHMEATIMVSMETANGEVGFSAPHAVTIYEPEEPLSRAQVTLELVRVGTNGDVSVVWKATGSGSNPGHVTSDDITPLQGTVTMVTGQNRAMITLTVLADSDPEMAEHLSVDIIRIEPQETQRIRPGGATIQLTIAENDGPGGVFHFAPQMVLEYTVEEELDAIELTIQRSGAALVARQLQYTISPQGEAEFYGDTNIINFLPGEAEKTVTVMARTDGIPELREDFELTLHSFGESTAIIGSPSSVTITVLSNEQPYGYFQFSTNETTIFVEESKGADVRFAQVPVQRMMGRFGIATVDWFLLNTTGSSDLQPVQGTLTFEPGVGEVTIDMEVIADKIPEDVEIFYVNVTRPTGGATLGEWLTAAVHVLQNDDPIYIKEPSSIEVGEPGTYNITIERSGRVDREVSVRYHTLDGSATEAGRDYVIITETSLVYSPGVTQHTVSVTILQDDLAEPDEVFYLELYDEEGDVAVFGPPAEIIIKSNDVSNGIVHFSGWSHLSVQEGQTALFELTRDVGIYGKAEVFCEIYHNATGELVQSGTDFLSSVVMATIKDLEAVAMLQITPSIDGVPEYDEVFHIVLNNVTGGRPEDPGRLADYGQSVYLTVLQNDDPLGHFLISDVSRETSIAEDTPAGLESSRVARISIERAQGSFTSVQVAWEVFSYQIAGAGNMPDMVDLLLVGEAPAAVTEEPLKRRVGIGTLVLHFSGCQECFVSVSNAYHGITDQSEGFSMSAWVQPQENTDGYIISRTSPDGDRVYYALRLAAVKQGEFYSLTLMFQYSTSSKPIVSEQQIINIDVADGHWHFILVCVDDGNVYFYVDGATRGLRSLEGSLDMVDNSGGVLLVGATMPGLHHYVGLLQDVRIYSRKLEENEVRELYETPSSADLFPISGYVTFSEGQLTADIVISALEDREEEANDVFSVKLISAQGGATVSPDYATATLTVLKSDNANGLFGFSAPCTPSYSTDEAAMFICPVTRQRGDADVVMVTWQVLTNDGTELATSDFVNATGMIVFEPGERLKMLSLQAIDDNIPEVEAVFDIHLITATSSDGLVGTTNTSGASIDPAARLNNLTMADNDYPYGLLQFDASGQTITPPEGQWIQPIVENPSMSVAEEVGVVSLMISRAQGTLGQVSVEWRTVDGTALSSGRTPPDFLAEVNRLTFQPGQLYSYVNVTILNNDIPEAEKYFWVELVNPRGGAAVTQLHPSPEGGATEGGADGSRVKVIIRHSDQAHGVFQIATSSMLLVAEETGDVEYSTVQVKVEREGGTIGQVNVSWATVNDTDHDLIENEGVVTFQDGQKDGEITVKIRGDTIPELTEQYGLMLVNCTKGSLGDMTDVTSYITVPANDDPYGIYVISETTRLIHVQEGPDGVSYVHITIERKPNTGTLGSVAVSYRTLVPLELYPHLPGGILRADSTDYDTQSGTVHFTPGQMTAIFNLTINDDLVPEVEETLFAILTGAVLVMEDEDIQEVAMPEKALPHIGDLTRTYSQVIIDPNDHHNGILEVSAAEVRVTEDTTSPILHVIRSAGLYGDVRVKFEVMQGSALYGLDYTIASTDLVLLAGQSQKVVPVEIINDRIPEPDEWFVVRLLAQVTGGAILGNVTECRITILESDDLHGAFGFESSTLSASEPEAGTAGEDVTFDIAVVRLGGTEGLITINWTTHIIDDGAVADIDPISGSVNFVSNQAREFITIAILMDDVPEGVESIEFELLSATNGGRILEDSSRLTLHILANDNPHGTLEFIHPEYIIEEAVNDTIQYVPITRSGGSYGALRVQYHTTELDIISEALRRHPEISDYFDEAETGVAPLRPDAGTPWNVQNMADPQQACLRFCLLTEACQVVYYTGQHRQCRWYTLPDVQYLDNRTGYILFQKITEKVRPLYTMRAKDGIDFRAVSEASVVIPDGATEGLLPVFVYSDLAPELNESFTITVTSVELQGEPPINPQNLPRLSEHSRATVTIEVNDDANGVFTVYSTDPRAENNGHVVMVEERAHFAVELVIDRQGGSIGTAKITWSVNAQRTTATSGEDFIGDGADVTFPPGITRRTITIGIEDDDIPEDDEVIMITLTQPQGGAVVAKQHEVMIRILANDYVAGLLSFKQTTYLVKEGDLVRLTILRSSPALGQVLARWRLITEDSQPPAERFRITSGVLYFTQGEVEKEILLHVLVDNQPKTRQEYRLQMFNLQTTGVSDTGAAAVDPTNGEAHITIEGGNEPHGVLGFAPQLLESPARVTENQRFNLTVDRKFGAIGVIRVYYDVRVGAVQTLTSSLHLAAAGTDFTPVSLGSLMLGDGQSSGTITLQLPDDAEPEVDEVFVVELESVELIQPADSTFLPKLDGGSSVAEVIINANDGTQGEVIFSATSSLVSVEEGLTNISLTVERTRGAFGTVSVYCYAQNAVTETGQIGAVRGEDFHFQAKDLVFGPGETEKIITIMILQDNLPEPDESLEVILDSPKEGLILGQPHKALITILANDAAGGVINFMSPSNLTVNEPAAGVDDVVTAGAAVSVGVVRGPGIYGVVTVQYVIMSEGGDPVTDIVPSSGVITFQNRQASVMLELTVVPDSEPEEAEIFTVVLSDPEGGATLGQVVTKNIIVERNDAPYGLIEIFPAGTRESSVTVEEYVGFVYFDVVRNHGDLGRVSVDMVTISDTARAQQGNNLTMSLIQQLTERLATSWYSFTAYGLSYSVLLSAEWTGDLTSPIGSTGSAPSDRRGQLTPSVLYKWQGTLVPVQTIETDGATNAVAFTMEGQTYLVIANQGQSGRRTTKSRLYTVSQSGSLTVVQEFATRGASDVAYLTHNSEHYVLITNYQDNRANTQLKSDLYRWEPSNHRFSSLPVRYLDTVGAIAIEVLDFNDEPFVFIASHKDSISNSYQLKSTLYRFDASRELIVHQQIPTAGATSLTSFTTSGGSYLIIANQKDNFGDTEQGVEVYSWNGVSQRLVLVQNIPTSDVQKVHMFWMEETAKYYLSVSALGGASKLYEWDPSVLQFVLTWSGPSLRDLYPMVVPQAGTDLVIMLQAPHTDQLSHLNIHQMAVLSQSDFVPRSVTVTFEPGQSLLQLPLEILDDEIPEDTESLTVRLISPRLGTELGPNNQVLVHILSNDDGHGVVEFAEDSLLLYVEEIPGRDNPIQMNVVRRHGDSGRVVVQWEMSGDHQGLFDFNPIQGTVEFADGQSVTTLSISVRDDGLPEQEEVSIVKLTAILQKGTQLPDRGAVIGARSEARLIVQANDSPYGVVRWERANYMVTEPEHSNSIIELYVIRSQGSAGHIQVSYMTKQAVDIPSPQQAVSGVDYLTAHQTVDLYQGQTQAMVQLTILPDLAPELSESFLVNITDVQLLDAPSTVQTQPTVLRPGGVTMVTIEENDNARGTVYFNVTRNQEGRIDVFEGIGTIKLTVSRTTAHHSAIEVSWQVTPREADTYDFTPAGGVLRFEKGELSADIEIYIEDDAIPEHLETFDVGLVSVTSGGAQLGTDVSVRVGISKNDSPNGIFSFLDQEVSVKESSSLTDPVGVVNLDILRVGTSGVVSVQWRLSPEAADDFVPPLAGNVTFTAGETRKTIMLRTRPDSLPEGAETYTVSLISASNNADISSSAGDVTIVIQADVGAGGVVQVALNTTIIYMAEPSSGIDGSGIVNISRVSGAYGAVVVSWQLVPRDLLAFVQVQGQILMNNLQEHATIVLQASDDSLPESRTSYTLELIAATNGATINPNNNTASIIMVASDYPHGLFEFGEPSEMVVQETDRQVSVPLKRHYGSLGDVRVRYTTSPGTALSLAATSGSPNPSLGLDQPDFEPSSGWVLFKQEEIFKTVPVTVLDDDLAEGPEQFYVNITDIQLVSPSTNNYSSVQGLQLDMSPTLGPLSILTIIIDKNDMAEGIIQFDLPPNQGFIAYEDEGVVSIPVVRSRGAFGEVGVVISARDGTALAGQDYILQYEKLTIRDGVSLDYVNITIVNDTLQEFGETFSLSLTGVQGGATLGERTTVDVTIAKSDYPNGRFRFQGATDIRIPNPDMLTDVSLSIDRTLGGLGKQTLLWRIMGPNDPNRILEETTDISYYDGTTTRERTSGLFTWEHDELGVRSFTLQVKPHTGWEIAKTYILMIYDIQGFPAEDGNGEIGRYNGNLTLTISKFGFPNGVVHFDGLAQIPRTLEEPLEGSTTLVFPLVRTEGTIGDIEIYWHVLQPAAANKNVSDIRPETGMVLIPSGVTTAQVSMAIMADDTPELDETFIVVLDRTIGGADIDTVYNTSTFSVSYNDAPHGEFGILPEYQTVSVQPGTLKRHLQLNITRFAGAYGRVRVSFSMKYDQAEPGISYAPATGTVLFNNAEPYAIVKVPLESQRFLVINSTFSVTLTDVVYVGEGETDPPVIRGQYSTAQVRVPTEAANSQMGFLHSVVNVNEVTGRSVISIHRQGTYGSVTLDWLSGYPGSDTPEGFEPGVISPVSDTLTLPHLTQQANFTIQVSPDMSEPSVYALHIPLEPVTSAPGGATVWPGHTLCHIEPHGVISFAKESREISVAESDIDNVEVVLYVERMYGSQDSIQIRYKTVSGTATGQLDYRQIDSGAITMDPRQTRSSIFIEIKKDVLPETDEQFSVVLMSVIRLPTGLQDDSPRLSTEHDTTTITIRSSNDPYGVFSVLVDGTGRVSEPGSVILTISRSGGTFGQVSVRVRTVGGGEPWDNLIGTENPSDTAGQPDTIGQVLAARNLSRQAIAGQDYQRLDMLLPFEEGATRSSVVLYVTDDTIPEDDESLYVYLQSLTLGARIAEPSLDNGLKGFAELVIEKNDFWNGWLGFNTTAVTVDEDTGSAARLTVERRNASFEEIQIYWRALADRDVQSVRTDRIDLTQQLITTTGAINCQSGQRLCHFYVPINNDQIPENATWFLVEVYLDPLRAEQGARIDPARRYCNITIAPSDHPNGLVQFDLKSRYMYISRSQDSVALRIQRVGYAGKQVSVAYHTEQLERPMTAAGTTVYHALEGADYSRASGTFVFEPGEVEKTILISRDPLAASDNPYPKLFNIHLTQVSNGASIGESKASVTITDQSDVTVWKLWAESQTDLNNNTMDDLMTELNAVTQSRSLTPEQMDIVQDLLTVVMDTAMEHAPIQDTTRTRIMRVLCDLLDPLREDAPRGRWQLSQIVEKFAFSYVAHLPCDTCCQENFLESPMCPHLQFVVAKRYPEDINSYRWNARGSDTLTIAAGALRASDHGRSSSSPKCYPVTLMDFKSTLWFTSRTSPNILLNNKVILLKIQDTASRILTEPVTFRIHTPGQGTPARRSECVYFDEAVQQWTSITQYGRQVCTVKNNLALALDSHVDCSCIHMSLYAVKSDLRNPNVVGYPIWFHISCFICMAGVALSILAHYICIYTRFSASLLMHLYFAVLGTQVCYVIDAYLSSYHLLNIGEEEDNHRCIVMSLFLHYFFMAQFTWMMAQAVNFFQILVLNDEHTKRKFHVYVLLGWGLPIILVAVFYIVTYLIFRFLTTLPPDRIYGDVASNGDICFVTHPIAGLAGIMAPCLIFLMVVGIVFIQAYQVSPQWQSYDDIYKGRHNIHEVRFIMFLFGLIVITWLWGGLHLAYGQLWMLVLFCVFNITLGVYVFIMYTALRTPCSTCMAQQKAVYAINDTHTDGSDVHVYPPNRRQAPPDSIHGSQHALVMHEQPWEKESITLPQEAVHTNSMLRVKRSAANTNIYVMPPTPYSDHHKGTQYSDHRKGTQYADPRNAYPVDPRPYATDHRQSRDLNELILALRAGEVLTSSDSFNPLDSRDITTDGSVASHMERKRISIADTHL